MAKESKENEALDAKQQLDKLETFYENNKQKINTIGLAILIVVGGIYTFFNFYYWPLQEESNDQLYKAQIYFEQDSFDLALNGDGNHPGFIEIIEEYGMSKAANLSHYYAGMAYLRKGSFEQSIEYLKGFSSSDELLNPLALAAIGDAYTELNDMEEGIVYYSKAANASENEFVKPLVLKKLGMAYEKQGQYEDALKTYETMKEEFPKSIESKDVNKYIARATYLAGK